MRARLATLAALALAATSCGGGPAAKDAAELVPADATAYAAFHGARPPGPATFPYAPPAYAQLEAALPRALTTIARSEDVAVLPEGAVAFVRPRDAKAYDKTLDARGLLHRRIRGWTVVATAKAPLDAVRHRHATLDRKPGYESPGDAPLAAYLTRRFGGIGLDVTSTTVSFRYRAPAAPTLGEVRVPRAAVAAVGLTGTPPAATLPTVRTVSGALGIELAALPGALGGPGVAWVVPGEPVPEVTVEATPSDPQRALRGVRRLLAGLGGTPSPAGALTAIDLGPIALLYGLDHGRLVITDAPDRARPEPVRGLPQDVTRFAYAHRAGPALASLAAILGISGPRDPRDFLLYETQADGVTTRVVSLTAP